MNIMKEICGLAISRYGKERQLNHVVEELNELAVAINHWRRGRASVEEVVDEIADVCITLEQLEIMLGVEPGDDLENNPVGEACLRKLNRLKDRLERGE